MKIKPLQERNQTLVAIVGTVLAAAVVLGSLNLSRIPFLNPQHTYYADFANADGLTSGRDVRVAGVSVGSVQSVKIEGDHVRVAFSMKASVHVGSQSTASIEIATVLGQLFMQVHSAGTGSLRPGNTIPVARTEVPYTLVKAIESAGQTAGKLDLGSLTRSFQSISETLSGIDRPSIAAALTGLQEVSTTIANRQGDVAKLLTDINSILDTVNSHSAALIQIIDDSAQFVQLLNQRHAVIADLFSDTALLGAQLRSLVAKYGSQVGSALKNIDEVAAVLAKDKSEIEASISVLGQFSVNITNADGSGPWLDLMLPYGLLPDNVIAACGLHPKPLCGK